MAGLITTRALLLSLGFAAGCGPPPLPAAATAIPEVIEGEVDACYVDVDDWMKEGLWYVSQRAMPAVCACAPSGAAPSWGFSFRFQITEEGRLRAPALSETDPTIACARRALSEAISAWLDTHPGMYTQSFTQGRPPGRAGHLGLDFERLYCDPLPALPQSGPTVEEVVARELPPRKCFKAMRFEVGLSVGFSE
jgi:hypothetical protein